MRNTYGENLKLTIFGQSHSPAMGMTLEGVPAGTKVDEDALRRFMRRRAPGRDELSTPRSEGDEIEFLSGFAGGVSCGAPICAVIRNTDARPGDYAALKNVPRPGHADYTASVKFGDARDVSGGGPFSGRLTAPLCAAGGIVKQLLEEKGICVYSRVYSIGDLRDEGEWTQDVSQKPFPTVSDGAGKKMRRLILSAKEAGDSVGGVIECAVVGAPAGLGDPMFSGLENRISQIVFAIPAVKGIEFGAGFEAAKRFGSQNNDAFIVKDGRIETRTNHCGGILGGISDGMPIVFRAAFKPTPSIALAQDSVDLTTLEPVRLSVPGRHDPCVVLRALPCVEAAAAIAIYDALLARRMETDGNQ